MSEETKDAIEDEYKGLSVSRQVVLRLSKELNKVAGERGKTYGDPEENFTVIAMMWNAYLRARFGEEYARKYPLHAYDIGYMNSLQKHARLGKTPLHPDSSLDAMNYTGLGLGCAMWEDQIIAAFLKDQIEKEFAKTKGQPAQEDDGSSNETKPQEEQKEEKHSKKRSS